LNLWALYRLTTFETSEVSMRTKYESSMSSCCPSFDAHASTPPDADLSVSQPMSSEPAFLNSTVIK